MYMHSMCVCLCTVYMHVCAWVMCMCVFISVWPFKRFLRGRGGREDNGSRHYLLLSCRLSVRPHTLWPSQTQTPSGCTCTHAPTRCTHVPDTLTHTRLCRDDPHACRAWSAHADTFCIEKVTHTYAFSHPHRCTLNTHTSLLSKRSLILRQDWQGFNVPDYILASANDWWMAWTGTQEMEFYCLVVDLLTQFVFIFLCMLI